ncbi:MAG: hypothetical protein HZA47_04440 [Planctomycetes bacterium]|nr:hypothetical protein [Planctomycetota bacterium]
MLIYFIRHDIQRQRLKRKTHEDLFQKAACRILKRRLTPDTILLSE